MHPQVGASRHVVGLFPIRQDPLSEPSQSGYHNPYASNVGVDPVGNGGVGAAAMGDDGVAPESIQVSYSHQKYSWPKSRSHMDSGQ